MAEAQRLELGQPRYNEFNMGLAGDTLFSQESSSVYAGLKKGDESNPYMQNIDELLSQGNRQYGMTGWDSLWGDQGQLLDYDALMRSMNATAFGYDPMNVDDASRKYSQYYSKPNYPNYPSSLDFSYSRQQDMARWMNEGSGWQQGYAGAQNRATEQGQDPNLVNWLAGINDFNRSINDSRERFFDPNNLSFSQSDWGGMDMNGATQDSLNAWAQENYGIDLRGLAGLGTELGGMRNDMMQDPSKYWDKNSRTFNTLSLPGMDDLTAASKMSAYEDAYARMQEDNASARSQAFSQNFNQQLRQNPELMRTAYGQYLGGSGGMAQNLQAMAGQRIQQPTDYSMLAGYGMAPNLANQALAQMGMQGGMY